MRFKNGFDECAAEVSRYISRLEGVDSGVKQRLTAHLHRCVNSLHQISTFPHQNMFSTLTQNCDKNAIVLPSVSSLPGDVNNNSNQERIQIPTGLQLIPSRLPTGELALLVPNSSQMSNFLNPNTNFQFRSSNVSPNFVSTLNTSPNHASAFTAVAKTQELTDNKPKEIFLDNDNFKFRPIPHTFQNDSEAKEKSDHDDFKKINMINNEVTQKYQYGKLKNFMQKPEVSSTKSLVSSTFQRNAADSTTSFSVKESDTLENNFKPFQVQLPNTHLKAQVSFPDSMEDVKLTSPIQIHQKPNPNFTLNPKHKSPHKFIRVHPVDNSNSLSENFQNDYNNKYDINFEKFSKIEPLSIITDKLPETNDFPIKEEVSSNTEYSIPLIKHSRSTETFQNFEPTLNRNRHLFSTSSTSHKRPLSNDPTETMSPTSSESPNKIPRISLNVMLTDDYSKISNENNQDRCQRISVIVEDVSKNNRENNEVAVSNQRDNMWRPW